MIKCPNCREESEDQFDSCWKCGAVLRPNAVSSPEEECVTIPEKLPEVRSAGHCWLYSILVPLGFLGLGILVALAQPKDQNDWIGVGFMIPAAIGSILAAVSALGFSALSIFRAEKFAMVAFVSGGVALVYLSFVLISVGKAFR